MAKKKLNESKRLYGVDIETHDPLLKDKGESWIWNEGEILIASVHEDGKKKPFLVTPQELSYFRTLFKDSSPENSILPKNPLTNCSSLILE